MTMTRNRFEVTYEYGASTRGTKIVEAYSEFDCQNEVKSLIGRNDVRILSIRRA